MNSEAFVQALQAGQSWINDAVSANDHNICFIIVTAAQTFVHSLSLTAVVSIYSFGRDLGWEHGYSSVLCLEDSNILQLISSPWADGSLLPLFFLND